MMMVVPLMLVPMIRQWWTMTPLALMMHCCWLCPSHMILSWPSTFMNIFPHKSEAEAINILRRYGTVRDVPGDGSCGYRCMMLLLCRMKLIDNTLSVSQFHRGIHQFIVSNMKKFVGVCPDGINAVFQYPWGQMSRLKKNGVIQQPVAQDLWLQKSWVEFGVSGLTILPLSVKHTRWTLHICSLSLLTSTKLDNLSYTTIVLHIQIVLMVVVALQHMCIVTTNPNAMYPRKQYLDWFMT